ncbi:MAG: PEP-CTERM sorting domain-containing protein [Planctomycetota bacterium]|nr:MAG: PEP-CTERM sorting domain-containing protein [Planctomycetota bacterium]
MTLPSLFEHIDIRCEVQRLAVVTVFMVAGTGGNNASAELLDLSTLTPTHQAWSALNIVAHNAGGFGTNVNGTVSVPYAPVGGNSLSFQPNPFPSDGGIVLARGDSSIDVLTASIYGPAVTFHGANGAQLSTDAALRVFQAARVSRNSTNSDQNGNAAALKSEIEWEVPDFGPETRILWQLETLDRVSLPNGGSGSTNLGEGSVFNLTTGEYLFETSDFLNGSQRTHALLDAAAGDILRFRFEASATADLPIGSSPFGDARVQMMHTFATVVDPHPQASPVPEPSSLALLGMGGLGLCGYRWRRKTKTRMAA